MSVREAFVFEFINDEYVNNSAFAGAKTSFRASMSASTMSWSRVPPQEEIQESWTMFLGRSTETTSTCSSSTT
jgi:hypothetical protein